MKALITGATSGIGREFAFQLSKRGYDLILIGRNKQELNKLKKNLENNVEILNIDLSTINSCYKVYEKYKDEDIDLFINNAGIGVFGSFKDTNLEEELDMINLNLMTPHILTKLFLNEFVKRNRGHILNVSSTAAFSYGPLMSSYYSTKSYIYKLTCSIYQELKHDKSNVKISVLCPGPVDTDFNRKIGIKFAIKPLSTKKVVLYTLKKLHKGTIVIVPGFTNRALKMIIRFIPIKMLLILSYKMQSKKVIK